MFNEQDNIKKQLMVVCEFKPGEKTYLPLDGLDMNYKELFKRALDKYNSLYLQDKSELTAIKTIDGEWQYIDKTGRVIIKLADVYTIIGKHVYGETLEELKDNLKETNQRTK